MVMAELISGSAAVSLMMPLSVPAWVMLILSVPLPVSQLELVGALSSLAEAMACARVQVASTSITGDGVLVAVGVEVGVGVCVGVGVWVGVTLSWSVGVRVGVGVGVSVGSVPSYS